MIDIIFVTHKTDEATMQRFEEVRASLDPLKHSLIFTGQPASASINRNYGLAIAQSDIIVMLDDDMRGFYEGWVDDLIKPLEDDRVILVSARLLNPDGSIGSCMGAGGLPVEGVCEANRSAYRGYFRLPTACIAFRKNPLRFNEGFVGSGYEDSAFMNDLCVRYPGKIFVVNNNCKLIHENRQVRQGGKFWEHNHKLYMSLYPDDETVKSQKDWCHGRENE